MPAWARIAASTSSTDAAPATAAARMAPCSRRRTTSARVSISSRATMPWPWSHRGQSSPVARRMSTARAWVRVDSERCGETP